MRVLAALIGVPLLALALLSGAYALVPWACRTGNGAALAALFAAMLLAAVVATILARGGIAFGAQAEADAVPANEPFLRFVALCVGAFFCLVIAAFWLVQGLVPPCL